MRLCIGSAPMMASAACAQMVLIICWRRCSAFVAAQRTLDASTSDTGAKVLSIRPSIADSANSCHDSYRKASHQMLEPRFFRYNYLCSIAPTTVAANTAKRPGRMLKPRHSPLDHLCSLALTADAPQSAKRPHHTLEPLVRLVACQSTFDGSSVLDGAKR